MRPLLWPFVSFEGWITSMAQASDLAISGCEPGFGGVARRKGKASKIVEFGT
jgi:hypothetical protein